MIEMRDWQIFLQTPEPTPWLSEFSGHYNPTVAPIPPGPQQSTAKPHALNQNFNPSFAVFSPLFLCIFNKTGGL